MYTLRNLLWSVFRKYRHSVGIWEKLLGFSKNRPCFGFLKNRWCFLEKPTIGISKYDDENFEIWISIF